MPGSQELAAVTERRLIAAGHRRESAKILDVHGLREEINRTVGHQEVRSLGMR